MAARPALARPGLVVAQGDLPPASVVALRQKGMEAMTRNEEREALDKIIRDADGNWPDAREAILAWMQEQGYRRVAESCTHPNHGKRLHECELPPIDDQTGQPTDADGSTT